MNEQTGTVEDLDRFRDMLRILAAGIVVGAPVSATANARTTLSDAR